MSVSFSLVSGNGLVNRMRGDETLSEIENLLGFFATFVLESELVRQILRWDMAVLRKSLCQEQIRSLEQA